MTQYRIKRNVCQCHPETCTHWRYGVEVLINGDWTTTGMQGDDGPYLHMRVEQEYPNWSLYEQEQS